MKGKPATESDATKAADLEAATDAAIAACDGDARAAVRALLVAVDHLQAALAERDEAAGKLAEAVSRGYSRGRWGYLDRAEDPIPYTRS